MSTACHDSHFLNIFLIKQLIIEPSMTAALAGARYFTLSFATVRALVMGSMDETLRAPYPRA